MKTREQRRDRTIRVGSRRRKQHLASAHPDGAVDCVCDFSVWRFAKRRGLGECNCRGRRHGNPKIGGGICHMGPRPSAAERQEGNRLAKDWADQLHVKEALDIDL